MSTPAGPMIRRLHRVQGGRCYLCGKTLHAPGGVSHRALAPTIDHIVPRVAGGIRWFPNIALACMKCNSARGHRPPRACERLFGEVVGLVCEAASRRRVVSALRHPWVNHALADAMQAAVDRVGR